MITKVNEYGTKEATIQPIFFLMKTPAIPKLISIQAINPPYFRGLKSKEPDFKLLINCETMSIKSSENSKIYKPSKAKWLTIKNNNFILRVIFNFI